MSLEIISRDILLKAERYKDEINLKFEKECLRIEEEHKKNILKYKEKKYSDLSTEIHLIRERRLIQARKEYKTKILETKKSILKQTYDLALDELETLSDKDITVMFKSLYSQVSKELEVKFVITSKKLSKLITSLIPKTVSVRIGEVSGFIFLDNLEIVSVDCQFKTILDSVFEKYEEEIYREVL